MSSLKQVIVNAVIKVSADPAYTTREYGTSEEARADFIKALIAELFPECPDFMMPSAVQVSEVRSYKEQTEARAMAAISAVNAEIRRGATKTAPNTEEQVDGGGPAPEKEKKKRAPKKKEAVPVVEAAPVAAGAGEAAPEKKKRGPKPKVVDGAVNHPKKLNKTEENKVKSVAKELKVEADDTKVLEYLNAMPPEEYAVKSFDEHVRAFLTTKDVAVVEEKVAKRGLLVEFNGKDYWIDPETKKVYTTTGSVDEHVGHVGMLEFEAMEIPEYVPEDLAVIAN